MSTYVLTGTFTPDRTLTETSAREICTYFATFLRSKHYKAYEVWAGYRPKDRAWRFLVALRGPVRKMPDLTVLNEVQDLFDGYVAKETGQTRWVEALEDPYCWDVEGWVDWGRGKTVDKEKEKEDGKATPGVIFDALFHTTNEAKGMRPFWKPEFLGQGTDDKSDPFFSFRHGCNRLLSTWAEPRDRYKDGLSSSSTGNKTKLLLNLVFTTVWLKRKTRKRTLNLKTSFFWTRCYDLFLQSTLCEISETTSAVQLSRYKLRSTVQPATLQYLIGEMVPWNAGASIAQDIWEGNVLVAEMPRVHDALSAKHVLEQFIVEAGGTTNTTDVIIGYHPGKEQWMLFGRLRWPEYMIRVPDDVEDQMPGSLMRQEHRDFLPRSFGIDVLDIKDTVRLFDPGANKQRYHAAIAELEPTSVSHVMLYRRIPYLLKKDGKIVRHDYNSYKATLHLDIGGLSKVLDRLKSEEDEVD